MRAALYLGLGLGLGWLSPAAPDGIGWVDATCPQAGRTLSETFYTRTYVKSCTWTWNAGKETPMQLAEGPDGGPATNVFIHFKANARCSDADWYRRVALGREDRAVCQHRGGKAVPT